MNTVEIEPTANAAEIIDSNGNSAGISLFDVYTTTYFLMEAMTQEEHAEVGR